MLTGGKAQLQVRGGRNHRSLHKEVVNLDVGGKERWEGRYFPGRRNATSKGNMGIT